MKNKIYLLSALVILLLSACEDLDRELVTTLSEKQVTSSYEYSKNRLSAIYANLPEGYLDIDNAMLASAADEAEHTIETSAIQKFNTGSWNDIDNPDNVWGRYYKAIRNANLFLNLSDSINLDVYRLDPATQVTYAQRKVEIKRWKSEAQFLRAFFYFELVKRYGGVPLIKTPLLIEDAQESVSRNTLEECVQFIVSECDSAARVLPAKHADAEMGRATKGAALSLKARVLLYAASDLYNNASWASGYAKPELISLTGDRQARWKAAVDAAKAVIDLAGTSYALTNNYRSLFNTFNNNEIILVRRNKATNDFEKLSFPIGFDYATGGTTPSQNLVDAYEMKDGTTFDWKNTVHAAAPFANRDPRLTLSIITNNSTYKGRAVEAWTGGKDGKGVERATKTGYYLKKHADENLDLLQNRTSVHSWILFRLAEVYLNYAEALNEYNPGHSDIKKYVDMVRDRAGIKMPLLPAGLTQEQMRERIRNERRVELAFEDHRFWDVRRWMIAPATLGGTLKGLEITKDQASNFTYSVIDVESRTFEPKMYWYPISQSELLKAKGLVQNPLW